MLCIKSLITLSLIFSIVSETASVRLFRPVKNVSSFAPVSETASVRLFRPFKNVLSFATDNIETIIYKALETMILTGKVPSILKSGILTINDKSTCISCIITMNLLIIYHKRGMSLDRLDWFINQMCQIIVFLPKNVCNGIMQLHKPTFMHIVENREVTGVHFCSLVLQDTDCQISDKEKWHVYIRKPPSEDLIRNTVGDNAVSELPINIAHFTDLHYDEEYTNGGNTGCGEPACCGRYQGTASSEKNKAGAWGDYKHCDLPMKTMQVTFEQIRQHEIDYIYFTGDIINHRVWETKPYNNMFILQTVYKKFREYFDDIPFYPILGNHEPSPLNLFPPEELQDTELGVQWLFDLMAEEWSHWLPESTKATIRKGGYYTVLVKPGFRIIALNNNVAFILNLWLLYYKEDPYGQLQWLSDTLHEAEKKNEIVHILAHVPPSDPQCNLQWIQQYFKIIDRYHHIIAAEFNGHTHISETTLHYSKDYPSQAVHVSFNGGSVTPWINMNPNYRVYSVNPQNYRVQDFDEWIFNMTEANYYGANVKPSWYKLYSFVKAWSVDDMTNFNELDSVIKRIITKDDEYMQYWRYKYRVGDLAIQAGFKDKEVRGDVCRLITSIYGDYDTCNKFLSTKYAFSWKKKFFGLF